MTPRFPLSPLYQTPELSQSRVSFCQSLWLRSGGRGDLSLSPSSNANNEGKGGGRKSFTSSSSSSSSPALQKSFVPAFRIRTHKAKKERKILDSLTNNAHVGKRINCFPFFPHISPPRSGGYEFIPLPPLLCS